MTAYPYRVAGIIPASLRDKANLVSTALGFQPSGGDTFAVALSGDGLEPATHFGFSTAAGANFVAWLQGVAMPPVDWGAYGLTEGDAIEIRDAIVSDVSDASVSALERFEALAQSINVQVVRYEI